MKILHQLARLFKKDKKSSTNTTPQRGVSLPRYLGRWYEQARYENWFESGMEQVFTDYTDGPDNSINVLNCGINRKGRQCTSLGRGFPTGYGRMEVSFVPPFWWFRAPYHILYVDEDYQNALVSGNGGEFLWLLTRQRHAADDTIGLLLREAQLRGFDTSKLRFTKQLY